MREEGIPKDPCWLKTLGVGSIFLIKRKNPTSDFSIGCFCVSGITDGGLYYLLKMDDKTPSIVEPIRFCSVFDLAEVLRTREEFLQEQEPEQTDIKLYVPKEEEPVYSK